MGTTPTGESMWRTGQRVAVTRSCGSRPLWRPAGSMLLSCVHPLVDGDLSLFASEAGLINQLRPGVDVDHTLVVGEAVASVVSVDR